MADNLSTMWMNLSLMEEESFELEAPIEEWWNVAANGSLCVIGKLIADRIVSKETIKSTLLNWWKIKGTLSFKILGENVFLVEFTDAEDKKNKYWMTGLGFLKGVSSSLKILTGSHL